MLYVRIAQLLTERRHLAFNASGNDLMNPRVAFVQIRRIVCVAMRTIHQKEMPALRSIGRQFRRLCRSLGAARKRNGTRAHFTLRSNRQ
jgi:hypothetical protein